MKQSLNNKLFIIVLYNCQLPHSESYKTIVKSLLNEDEQAGLYIYDNSVNEQQISASEQVWSELKYVHDPTNSGLGVAYNSGASFAQDRGYRWIILLDQDTKFSETYVNSLNLASLKFPDLHLFAPMLKLSSGQAFSPIKYRYKSWSIVTLDPGVYSLNIYAPVNSGMMIDIKAFMRIGGYVKKIRLDFADFQFIERFRKVYSEFYVLDSIAVQDFSNDEPNLDKSLSRFKIYLECAAECDRPSITDDVLYLYLVTRHTFALTLKFKNLNFAKLLLTNYLKKNR